MVKSASSGNKHKKHPPNDSKTFRIGLETEEKVLRHRKAQSEYYARNPDARVRRRERAAEARAAAKLKKRRWDPPKAKRMPPLSISEGRASVGRSKCSGEQIATASSTFKDDPFDFQDPRAHTDSGMDVGEHAVASDVDAVVGTAASPTSEEFLALSALAQLAEGVVSHVLQDAKPEDNTAQYREVRAVFVSFLSIYRWRYLMDNYNRENEVQVNENTIDDWRAGSVDSILEMANQLSSHKSDAAHAAAYQAAHAITTDSKLPLAVQRGELPPGVAPLNRVQEMALAISGHIGHLSTVQAAQLEVTKVNSGELSLPSPDDGLNWSRRPRLTIDQWPRCDWTKKEVAISCWRTTVGNAVEKSRRRAARKEAHQTAEDGKLGRWFQQAMQKTRLARKEQNDEIWASGGVSEGDRD
ncbi:hypothetical protein C8R43DRAFT_961409 [Mycena crocata]|nr:hypothetical protein C8R43DRAFT_961409 [Mycena crocata]